jgi:hypothetical protein
MNEQVELSLGSLDSWITSLLRDGTRRTDSSTPLPWDDGAQIDKNELYADYLAFARAQGDRYPTKQAPFWKRLRQVTACDLPHEQVTDKVSGVRRRVIRLPPLDATRRNAARVLGLPELADDCTSENE